MIIKKSLEDEFIKCPECGEIYNLKYLDQVILHTHSRIWFDETIKGEKMSDKKLNEPTKAQVLEFLKELEQLCKKHNLMISHEDEQGAFEIIPYDEDVKNWLMNADYGKWFDDTDFKNT